MMISFFLSFASISRAILVNITFWVSFRQVPLNLPYVTFESRNLFVRVTEKDGGISCVWCSHVFDDIESSRHRHHVRVGLVSRIEPSRS